MTQAAQKIIEDALALPDDEIEEVIEALLDRLHPDDQPVRLDPELHQQVADRIGEIQRGEVKTIPWEDVKAEGRKKLEELDK